MNTLQTKGELARRTITLESKAFGSEGAGTIEGYASVKNSIDSYGDTIIDGAYVELDTLVRDGFVTFGHENYDCPVAYIVEAKEDEHGLWVKAAFHSTSEAQDIRKVCMERMAAGKSVGLSIDFYPLEREFKDEDGVTIRVLKKIRVVGFAIVNLPAERLAEATSAKAGTGSRMSDQFESLLAELDDWTGRMEWIAANRKQGLSEVNKGRLGEVKTRLESLLALNSPTTQEEAVPLGAILELEQFAAGL